MAEPARKTSRGTPPINHHPLFPAIAALWGGAIFALIGLAIVASHGSSTRLTVTLAMTALGAIIGFFAANRFARRQSAAMDGAQSASVTEVIGPFTAATPASEAPGLSGLVPQDEAEHAPMGPELSLMDEVEVHDVNVPEIQAPEAATREPWSEGPRPVMNVAEFGLDQLWDSQSDTPDEASNDIAPTFHDLDAAVIKPDPQPTQERRFDEPAANDSDEVFGERDDDYPSEPMVDAPEAASNVEPEMAPEQAPTHNERTPPPLDIAPVSAPKGSAAQRIASAELEDLSNLELLERLALSMNRRRAMAENAAPIDEDNQPVPIFSGATPSAVGLQQDPSIETAAGHIPAQRPARGDSRNPVETEKALRTALAALQRMSGAA